MVRRYEASYIDDDEDGGFVQYSDYAALERELEEGEDKNERA